MKGLTTMRKLGAGLIALVGVGVMAGCTTNKTVGNPVFTTHAKLQLAVGTLNDSAGTLTSAPGTYLNAVSTFRNQFGTSAFISPGNSTLAVPAGTPMNTCGLFSYGQNPAAMLAPFGNTMSGPGFIGNYAPAFGAPPALSPANSNGIGYDLGYLLYFNSCIVGNPVTQQFVLPPAPAAGTYTLSTVVAVNGKNVPYSASATLGTPTVLPADPTPSYAPGPAGSGSGTFTVAVPAGVTESLVVVVNNANFAVAANVLTNTTTAVVPAGTLAPGSYGAFVIGADWPLAESSPPNSNSQTPPIVGAGGTADITVSNVLQITQP
jgi:hypothetical protein